MASKRPYKLQEFVADASNVNCVKFGGPTSRMFITGGEDLMVNLWAVGKRSALQSLSGLTSPVESVSFDSSQVMIGAGAASGTIKIWDVKEAKVVQTFTGHRSNCASLDFHPFGELLASGSSDTNMKIWDIRKKQCSHTYKGHTRRIDVLKFTPDGRWIVSGGADNSVKIWDLTAGKLLHDFNLHKGPINCLDFHPREFMLVTGSADKTVKFWDLDTSECIGSSGPKSNPEYFVPANVVRSVKFNSDGKTLFCGLHESLKVLSWEPIIYHDVHDVDWSTLADLTVDEGELLGCSYNQNCVSIWVVPLTRTEPSAVGSAETHLTGSANRPVRADSSISTVFGPCSLNYDNLQREPTLDGSRWDSSLARRQSESTSNEEAMAVLMESHQEFINVMKSRETKLEVAYRGWQDNDIKGLLEMSDCAVTANIFSVIMENRNSITLDTCTSLLQLASSLLESTYERHLTIALEMVLKLVESFGATISSTLSAAPPVGVDLEAEQRLERCKLCIQELRKVRARLTSVTR